MRRLLLLFPLLSLCSTACESDGRELFTQLSVRFILPDDRPVERIELLSDISYCENINTKERVFFTVLDGRSATLTLQKGVYTPHRRGQPALHRRNGAIRPQRRP